ncbi:hypothetical protein ACPPVO_58805 [Dactylosporangium sp. McL0621]|uniref:hypothetical protein n=1 Tax=Dactylosporangium sp. McL0621 TaxID=3415678 RepID=UPI003CFB79A8
MSSQRRRRAPLVESPISDELADISPRSASSRLPLRWAFVLMVGCVAAALVLFSPIAAAALGAGIAAAVATDQMLA